MVGGKDDNFANAAKRDAAIPRKTILLENAFHRLFPTIPFRTDFAWDGTFSSTKDGLPYIGTIPERPHTWFALGFGGNGIIFSVIARYNYGLNEVGKSGNPSGEVLKNAKNSAVNLYVGFGF